MRGVLTTACEVVGLGCVGFAFGWFVGLLVFGAALFAAGVIEGRRA